LEITTEDVNSYYANKKSKNGMPPDTEEIAVFLRGKDY
jgi:hypothetical protein